MRFVLITQKIQRYYRNVTKIVSEINIFYLNSVAVLCLRVT